MLVNTAIVSSTFTTASVNCAHMSTSTIISVIYDSLVKWSLGSCHTKISVMCYVFTYKRDKEHKCLTSQILKTTNILKSIIEQKVVQNKVLNNMRISLYSCMTPLVRYRFCPWKLTCTDISRTVRNFWTVVEQEMYKITTPFFWYQPL